ncbi:MAG: sulfotransferase domain-containing protein [Verrucomicrobiota bacterium]|nr:sulfotransferase domain-containing protein [Verrucomicrobiota bacterium]
MNCSPEIYELLDTQKYQEANLLLQSNPNSSLIPSSQLSGFLCYTYYKLGEYEKILPLISEIKSDFYSTKSGKELFPYIGKTLLKNNQLDIYHKIIDSLPNDYFLFDYRSMDDSISAYKEINGSKKAPILFNTLPKSGTVFINAFLSSLLKSKTILAPINQFPHSTIHWKTIEKLQNRNFFIHGHFSASKNNIEVIKKKVHKVILHLRDPRQAVYSWYRFIDSNYENTGPYLYNIPDDYCNFTQDEKYHFFFNDELNTFANWIENWLTIKKEKNDQILFTTYEKFVDNKHAYYTEILDFLNMETHVEHIMSHENALHNRAKSNKLFHFREGKKSSWKEQLPTKWINHLNDRISDTLLETFGWLR